MMAACLTPHSFAQLSTEDHLADPGFWPTQDSASRDGFMGPEACLRCHAGKASSARTPMGHAAINLATMASTAEVLAHHPTLAFTTNGYAYRIDTKSGVSHYSISSNGQKLDYPLLWAFGTGRVGQSYLFKKPDGNFYEARVTYFTSGQNLGVTPARGLAAPNGIDEAMYRPVPASEVAHCFGCHTTASSIRGQFDEAHLIPGVTCEACHGPGSAHVAAMTAKPTSSATVSKSTIFNSAHLSPNDAVDFCGACHGTWWDAKLSGVTGVSSARSAPYRLVTSKCWGKGDSRLVCTSCHDPHQPLETNAAAYDAACLNCHAKTPHDAAKTMPACPIAKERCTSCHMQKVFVPEMQATFTDHRIRIVRDGELFPE
jgi:hypothetical protein